MKTAAETVQEFLFKDKPKRKYCNDFDVNDLVNLLSNYAEYYHKHKLIVEKDIQNLIALLKKEKSISDLLSTKPYGRAHTNIETGKSCAFSFCINELENFLKK